MSHTRSRYIHNLEHIQRRAARFIYLSLHRILDKGVWPTWFRALAGSHSTIDATPLSKIQYGTINISPDFVQLKDQCTRGSKRLGQLPIQVG